MSDRKNTWHKLLSAIFSGAATGAILDGGRGVLIGVGISLILIAFQNYRNHRKAPVNWKPVAICAIVLTLFAFPYFTASFAGGLLVASDAFLFVPLFILIVYLIGRSSPDGNEMTQAYRLFVYVPIYVFLVFAIPTARNAVRLAKGMPLIPVSVEPRSHL